MNQDTNDENKRASRICQTIIKYHLALDNIYEQLVDRDFIPAKKEIDYLISELRGLTKSTIDDDF